MSIEKILEDAKEIPNDVQKSLIDFILQEINQVNGFS